MRFLNVLRSLSYDPWLIEASAYAAIHGIVTSRLSTGGQLEDGSMLAEFVNPRREARMDHATGLGHIHVCGVLGKGFSAFEKSCGNTGYEDIANDIDAMKAAGAEALIYTFDSPGGNGLGLPEAGDAIRYSGLPSVAFSSDQCCSAAYWLAASCDAIVGTRSSQWGSVGVILPWVDSSARLEMEGLRPQPITNRDAILKSIGYAGSLTDEQLAHLQASAEALAEEFWAWINTSRRLAPEVKRGGVIRAADGVMMELVDELGDYARAEELALEIAVVHQLRVERI